MHTCALESLGVGRYVYIVLGADVAFCSSCFDSHVALYCVMFVYVQFCTTWFSRKWLTGTVVALSFFFYLTIQGLSWIGCLSE